MEFISMGENKAMGNIPLKFLPSQIAGLKFWNRFNTGITVTGSGVSQWDDQSGNGNHLKQATDANRPSKESDGSILCNGIDQFLKADAFTFNQPEELFLLLRQITWTGGDRIFDGNLNEGGGMIQNSTTPDIRVNAGANLGPNSDFTVNTYAVLSIAINGVLSILQVNNGTPITGDAGINNMSGFTLGARGGISSHSNIQAKEVIGYGATLDATERSRVIKYLARVGGLSI